MDSTALVVGSAGARRHASGSKQWQLSWSQRVRALANWRAVSSESEPSRPGGVYRWLRVMAALGHELRARHRSRARDEVRRAAIRPSPSGALTLSLSTTSPAPPTSPSEPSSATFRARSDLLFDREMQFQVLGDALRSRGDGERPDIALRNAYIETFERLEAEAGTLAPLKKILRAQPESDLTLHRPTAGIDGSGGRNPGGTHVV